MTEADLPQVGPYSEEPTFLDAYGFRPQWRGRVHLVAAIVALPATLFLLLAARSATSRVAVGVFAASLIGTFSVSAAYHRVARTQAGVKWFRRADHSMIFVLIAGTYTPICLLALPGGWGISMLVTVWVVALAGAAYKMARLGSGPDGSWLYIVLGWAAVIISPALISNLDGPQLALMATGGLIYTLGALGFSRRWPDIVPHRFGYHEVWHTMTVAAGGCHFALVALVLP
jgi:hemolysin III